MRNELAGIKTPSRSVFFGDFLKVDANHKRIGVLLKHITDDADNFLCDHAWLYLSRENAKTIRGITPGERIMFAARIKQYTRMDASSDFGFANAKIIQRVKKRRKK